MSKWYGKIGFAITSEVRPSIYIPTIVERNYYGEVMEFSYRNVQADQVNDDLRINSRIRIYADSFVHINSSSIAYAEYMGNKWKVTELKPDHPGLILTLGGVYNEDQAGT